MSRRHRRRVPAMLSAFHATGALAVGGCLLVAYLDWCQPEVTARLNGGDPDPLLWVAVALMFACLWMVTGLLINEIRRPR